MGTGLGSKQTQRVKEHEDHIKPSAIPGIFVSPPPSELFAKRCPAAGYFGHNCVTIRCRHFSDSLINTLYSQIFHQRRDLGEFKGRF